MRDMCTKARLHACHCFGFFLVLVGVCLAYRCFFVDFNFPFFFSPRLLANLFPSQSSNASISAPVLFWMQLFFPRFLLNVPPFCGSKENRIPPIHKCIPAGVPRNGAVALTTCRRGRVRGRRKCASWSGGGSMPSCGGGSPTPSSRSTSSQDIGAQKRQGVFCISRGV